jgi:hypothetical protein
MEHRKDVLAWHNYACYCYEHFGEDEVERATLRRGRRRLSHSGSSTYRRSVTCRINFLMIMIFSHTWLLAILNIDRVSTDPKLTSFLGYRFQAIGSASMFYTAVLYELLARYPASVIPIISTYANELTSHRATLAVFCATTQPWCFRVR